MKNKLQFGEVLSNAFKIGLKNFLPLLGAGILWILTIWIPYLNVGTTIAMSTLPLALKEGKMISPLEIFDAKYRKYMGEFFLLISLRGAGISMAALFFVIPGIVISIAWSMAVLLLFDKNENIIESLKKSNEMTYGQKWTIFFVNLVLVLPLLIPFLNFIYAFILIPVFIAAKAYIYSVLSDDKAIET